MLKVQVTILLLCNKISKLMIFKQFRTFLKIWMEIYIDES